MDTQQHIHRLKQALSLAESQRGFCAPNPSVGALVVKEGELIAEGVHRGPMKPHAEVEAIHHAGNQAEGASLYVTLEPCCHWGRTPPCTDLIVKSRIKAVYYAFQDPNPKVAGQGAKQLQAAGIECHSVELPEVTDFYRSYHYWIREGRPWVTAKLAISLDGKIAGPHGEPVSLTGAALKRYTHECRKKSDAILTSIHTIVNDNPQLNVRLGDDHFKKPIYVLDSTLRLPTSAKIFQTAERITVFHAETVQEKKRQPLLDKNVRCIPVSRGQTGLDLNAILKIIGEDGIHDLWVETGGQSFESFLKMHRINRALIYIAPLTLGPQAMPAFHHVQRFSGNAAKVTWHAYADEVVCDIHFH